MLIVGNRMDLDFDSPRILGRAAAPPLAELVRELTPADLALLETERSTKAPALKQLRDSHHSLARCLASGMKPAEASLVTGYSLSRISILQADDSFQELLTFYRSTKDEIFADLHARMATLSLEAEAELRERLHESPESFSPGMLLEIVKTLADRTGHGPSSKSTVLNLNVDLAGRLERARARVVNPALAEAGTTETFGTTDLVGE
jgi:hypothetical protein